MTQDKFVQEFHGIVDIVLTEGKEKELLFGYLKAYHESFDLDLLVEDLKKVINCPDRIPLYDAIRPLIPLRHQLNYDSCALSAPEERLRSVRLQRHVGENLGFSVRGGYEHGVGFYVSYVIPDSQAALKGLRTGDEIVRVNGFNLDQTVLEELYSFMRNKKEITLKVRYVGMLPAKEDAGDDVSWRYAVDPMQSVTRGSADRSSNATLRSRRLSAAGVGGGRLIQLFVNTDGAAGLGCNICSGPPHRPGIYVQSIRAGGMAAEVGLAVGDQLVEVNGIGFHGIAHSAAVVALKSSPFLFIKLWRGSGAQLFRRGGELYEDDKEKQLIQLTTQKSNSGQQNGVYMYPKKEAVPLVQPKGPKPQLSPRQRSDQMNDNVTYRRTEEQHHITTYPLPSPTRARPESIDTVPSNVLPFASDDVILPDNVSRMFTPRESGGRKVERVMVHRMPFESLGIDLEGGSDSVLSGRIVVGGVDDDSPAHKAGIKLGDFLLMIGDSRLVNIPLDTAKEIIAKVLNTHSTAVPICVARAPPQIYSDETTYL